MKKEFRNYDKHCRTAALSPAAPYKKKPQTGDEVAGYYSRTESDSATSTAQESNLYPNGNASFTAWFSTFLSSS